MTDTAHQTEMARASALAFRWMLGAIVSFSAMAVAGRELSAELDTFEIMAYRSLIGLPIILFIMWRGAGWASVKTHQPVGHMTRNVIHFTAQNCWFYGVAVIPLAQITALEFTNPIWVLILAPLLLGEKMTWTRAGAALLGFVGVLIVAKPGIEPLTWGHAAGLAAAIGFALTNITTKKLSRQDGLICILFWMTLSQAVMGLVCAAPGGITLFSAALTPWVLFVGVCGLSAHYCLTRALSIAPAIVVAPMEFLRLPVLALIGVLAYSEPLEVTVFVGALIILSGNLLNLWNRKST